MSQNLSWKAVISITLCVVMALNGANAEEPQRATDKPNFLVIYVDDLDFDEVGVTGGDKVITPSIDNLANESLIYNNGYITSSICTPSRYSVLTGRYASRSQALQTDPSSTWRRGGRAYPPGGPANVHFNAHLKPGEKTIGHYLQNAGYETGFTGKWHLGTIKNHKLALPDGVGHDSPEGQAAIRKFYNEQRNYVSENFGFDYVDGFYGANAKALSRNYGYPKIYDQHNPEWMTAKAIEFMRENKDNPFFLFYGITLPHGENWGLVESVSKGDPTITPSGILSKAPASGMPSRASLFERVEEARLKKSAVGMLWVDDAVGALKDALVDLEISDKTIVFFISDHGNGAKCALYDGGARAPYFVKFTDEQLVSVETSDALVSNIDVVPTILQLSGGSADMVVDGKSLLPTLEPGGEIRDALLLEVGYGRAIVTEDWKYIALRFPDEEMAYIESLGGLEQVNYNASPGSRSFREVGLRNYPNYYELNQLYNLTEDPREQNNLYNDPAYAKKQEALKQAMRRELAKLPHTFGEFE